MLPGCWEANPVESRALPLTAMGVAAGDRTWPAPYSPGSATFVVTSAGSVSTSGGSSPSTLTATPIRLSR